MSVSGARSERCAAFLVRTYATGRGAARAGLRAEPCGTSACAGAAKRIKNRPRNVHHGKVLNLVGDMVQGLVHLHARLRTHHRGHQRAARRWTAGGRAPGGACAHADRPVRAELGAAPAWRAGSRHGGAGRAPRPQGFNIQETEKKGRKKQKWTHVPTLDQWLQRAARRERTLGEARSEMGSTAAWR